MITSQGMDIRQIIQRQQMLQMANNWRLTPATFAHKMSRGAWIPSKHLLYISSVLASGIARGNARIIVSAPPRHGKSMLISTYTPQWHLENYPNRMMMLTGYGSELTTDFARQVRDAFLLEENQALLKTRIRRDAMGVDNFMTTDGGRVLAAGVNGPINGRGADTLFLDDYIKDVNEAMSQTYRDKTWNWFVTTAFSRLEPNGNCIIIATRWHSDDLIGRILKNLGHMGWQYIKLPAIAQEDDLLGRKVGEALFPERFDIARLMELKSTLGTAFFNALYQQEPIDESTRFADSRWIKIINAFPAVAINSYKFIRVWDLAATQDGGDYTVGTLMCYNPTTGHTIILHVTREQLSPGGVEQLVRDTADVDGPGVTVGIEQEPGSAGKALVSHYARNVLADRFVVPIPTANEASKAVRAQPFLQACEQGHVSMIAGVWNAAFLTEMDTFPGGANDDQIDTAAGAYSYMSGKLFTTATFGRRSAMERDRNSQRNYTSELDELARKLRREGGTDYLPDTSGVTRCTFGR